MLGQRSTRLCPLPQVAVHQAGQPAHGKEAFCARSRALAVVPAGKRITRLGMASHAPCPESGAMNDDLLHRLYECSAGGMVPVPDLAKEVNLAGRKAIGGALGLRIKATFWTGPED